MKKLLMLLLLSSCLFLSSCAKKDVPTFEEYKAANATEDYSMLPAKTRAYVEKKRDENLQFKWDWEYGDLMHHADGRLRDQNLLDDLTPKQSYWVLILALWLIFVVWAGVGCCRNPIASLIASIIGLIGAAIICCW